MREFNKQLKKMLNDFVFDRIDEIGKNLIDNNKEYIDLNNKYVDQFDKLMEHISLDTKEILTELESCSGSLELFREDALYTQGMSDGIKLYKALTAKDI